MWTALILMALTPTISAIPPTMAICLCAGLLICVLAQARYVVRFSPLVRKEVADSLGTAPDRSASLLVANVLMTNENSHAFIAAVERHQPDIVLTLESNRRWEDALAALAVEYPYRVAEPLENLYGMHLYSKLPLDETETTFLIEDDVPSIHTLIELPSGETVRAHFLHPAPPSPSENASSEERDSELILVAKSLEDDDLPVLVAGDLNDVSWSRIIDLFKRISGMGDVRVGRGLYATFNANYRFLRWPLDHLFVSSHFRLVRIERVPIRGSDHFALLTEFELLSSNELESTGNLSEQEKQDVAETLESQDEDASDVPQPGH